MIKDLILQKIPNMMDIKEVLECLEHQNLQKQEIPDTFIKKN